MREILFKAKLLDNGEWVEGALDNTPINERYKGRCYQVNPETVCQYTGLTDKNGEKIFENDILSIYGEPTKYHESGVVFFSKEYLAWFVKFRVGDEMFLHEYTDDCAVVIGNIHDKEAAP